MRFSYCKEIIDREGFLCSPKKFQISKKKVVENLEIYNNEQKFDIFLRSRYLDKFLNNWQIEVIFDQLGNSFFGNFSQGIYRMY